MAKGARGEQIAVKLDFATLAGLVIGIGGIVGGLILEGGSVREIAAPTALLIVLGGTMGAVLITTPLSVLRGGMRSLASVLYEKSQDPDSMIEKLVDYSSKARKNGIVSLEQVADQAPDPFLRKALNLAVDGTDLQELRNMMELEIAVEEHHAEAEARIFESAGGYAPTIGIIGAVLGLIQVMKDLADIEKVGHGIATAFVATIYGVAFANLFFLPVAGKIKARAQQKTQMKELMLEGVVGIVEGLNPKLIRSKLGAYSRSGQSKAKAAVKEDEKADDKAAVA
jgi:chemotaxis protein MotA